MRTPPEGLDERDLVDVIARGWGFATDSVEFVPVGAGSYHWVAQDASLARRFVTVDDLDQKSFLGYGRTAAFEGLQAALRTAGVLRERAGLEFVVAPINTTRGEPVLRIDERYAVALYPFVEARPGQWGQVKTPSERAPIVHMLVDLHAATPVARSVARARGLEVAGRRDLEATLHSLGRVWTGGPFSEPVREEFVVHAARVSRLLNVYDNLVRRVQAVDRERVVTHGEPHPGNVLQRQDGHVLLIDWDTVAIALPERDLWMLASETGEELALYAAATGRDVDPVALELYRIGWDLADLAAYTRVCRVEHQHTADTERAFQCVRLVLSRADRQAAEASSAARRSPQKRGSAKDA